MTPAARGVDLDGLHAAVAELLSGAEPGAPLSPVVRSLVGYAVCTSVPVLDLAAARLAAAQALDDGATVEQLHEVLALVSGLGLHTLMEGSRDLADLVTSRGGQLPEVDEGRSDLRQRLLGGGTYWDTFEEHVPGFLDALLRLSPEAFEAFVSYGALPARTRRLPPVVKELVSVAVDALPTHRYLPGLRLHVAGALRLGAGRAEVEEAVAIASHAPEPPGVG